jgi:ABC-type multidrug transport system permease subunit
MEVQNVNIGRVGKHARWSALSLVSIVPVILLHLVHWLVSPLLVGAAADMHAHHQSSAGSGSGLMDFLLIAVLAANAVSAYFAIRQLVYAWRERKQSTFHSYVCSAVSISVLTIGIYTVFVL